MLVTAISDTHMLHRSFDVPKGDLLIHAGDASISDMLCLIDFNEWLGSLSYDNVIFVPGNHDSFFVDNPMAIKSMTNATVLIDNATFIDGIKFYGYPWTPSYGDWSFMLPRNGEELQQKINLIHTDSDVLISHGPAFGFLDNNGEDPRGCELLREHIDKHQYKYHVFGHVHESYGMKYNYDNQRLMINAAVLPKKQPICFEI